MTMLINYSHVKAINKLRNYSPRLNSPFTFLWIMMFMIIFSDSLSWPTIPYLIREFLAEETAVVTMLGLLTSIFSIIKISANILGAFLGDRFDRRLIILLALAIFPASFALILFARDHIWILGSYILFGVFYGILTPSLNAMVASLAQRESRGMIFGVFNLSWIISQIPSPIIGGFLSETVFLRFPLILSLALSLITLILFIIFMGILKGISSSPQPAYKDGEPQKIYIKKRLLFLCFAQLFSGLGNGVLLPVITAYLVYVIGASPADMGIAYSLGWGLATALAQIPGGKLSDRFGYKPIIMTSTLIGAPLILLLPFSRTLTHFILINALSCISGNLSSPAFSAYIATLMRERLSRGFGLTSAFFSIGSIIGPIIGSILWAISKPDYIPPFATSTIFLLLTLPFIAALKSENEE